MRKVKINVDGRVQGVGFRYMTKLVADKLGVKGEVWNEADGSVSIFAIAQDEIMEMFIKMVKASPSPSGRVDHFKIVEAPELAETNKFKVVYK
ncbi:acylphosphatase [Pilibacter termitis]|uniref:acylphosphatase n=1 Tax=Pilibacter termitis TaxID=263852 RepID=A0A1T4R7U9_9ENTE|nr:acylphosphatase [Pilibacter termitis]SKA11995.1 acylphosphatase [Pilibacter termitis]